MSPPRSDSLSPREQNESLPQPAKRHSIMYYFPYHIANQQKRTRLNTQTPLTTTLSSRPKRLLRSFLHVVMVLSQKYKVAADNDHSLKQTATKIKRSLCTRGSVLLPPPDPSPQTRN
jgi:hypothetical protein